MFAYGLANDADLIRNQLGEIRNQLQVKFEISVVIYMRYH